MDKISWPVAFLGAAIAIAFAVIGSAEVVTASRVRAEIAVACIAAGGEPFGRHCEMSDTRPNTQTEQERP